MNIILRYLIFIIIGYFCGSLLFGYFIPLIFFKTNTIKNSNDHNPGSANAFKLCGSFCGIIVIIMEILKGIVPIYLARKFVSDSSLLFSLVMLAPVIGHAFPLFMGFKRGGKCIAVSFGVLLGLFPYITSGLILAFWFIFFSLIIIVNPHSLRCAFTYIAWIITILFVIKSISIIIGCIAIGTVVILRHLKSIKQTEERKVRFAFQKN